MNAIAEVMDQATATAALNRVRDVLAAAILDAEAAKTELRGLIIDLRPSGVLTVSQIAEAVGRDRNYVDSVWSAHAKLTPGAIVPGKQTRVSPAAGDDRAADLAASSLSRLAGKVTVLNAHVAVARADRDRTIAMIYASTILGPSAIAEEVGIDRNHVLRLARSAGIGPVHREVSRNQYSAPAEIQPEAATA